MLTPLFAAYEGLAALPAPVAVLVFIVFAGLYAGLGVHIAQGGRRR